MKVALLALAAVTCAACSSTDGANGAPQGGAATGAQAGNASASAGSGGQAGLTAGNGGRHAEGGSTAGRSSAGGAGQPSTDGGDCAHDGDHTTTLVFVNRCAGAVTFVGSDIEEKTLGSGDTACVDIGSDLEALSAKRYWGFAGDDPGAEHHSLAEFTFNTDFNDFDWYNISYVDAFNLPLQIVPRERADCETLTCATDFLADCPDEGEYRNASDQLVACVSPERNDGNSPVAQYFEACDDAYAWSGDDQQGDDPSPVRACAGEDFDIVFCPGAAR